MILSNGTNNFLSLSHSFLDENKFTACKIDPQIQKRWNVDGLDPHLKPQDNMNKW